MTILDCHLIGSSPVVEAISRLFASADQEASNSDQHGYEEGKSSLLYVLCTLINCTVATCVTEA